MTPIKILDVGQCGFDGPRMAKLFRDRLHAQVDNASTGDDARKALARSDYHLVLVNRILAADDSSGLDLIRDLLAADKAPPIMLVSDQADAQAKAVQLGALKGFGKADLETDATLDLIARATAGTA